AMNFGSGGSSKAKAWKDIWGCGQGIGVVDAVRPAANIVDQLADEYHAAAKALDAKRY
ncbi:MAG TPA: nitronate monooxygenase, partial [Alcanivorax sp.]|nr:nitronate monooxygenase [Alcanivorax sp.]